MSQPRHPRHVAMRRKKRLADFARDYPYVPSTEQLSEFPWRPRFRAISGEQLRNPAHGVLRSSLSNWMYFAHVTSGHTKKTIRRYRDRVVLDSTDIAHLFWVKCAKCFEEPEPSTALCASLSC